MDDGSTDQSGAMCDVLAAELPGLQVLHRENGGLANARNTGLAAAKGEWLLFLDSDDAMAPGLLEQLRGALAAHPDCDWFIGKHLEWQPDGTLTPHTGLHLVPGPFDSDDYASRLKSLYRAGHWSVWKYCIRRAWLADTGVRFWDDVRWAEDWPFDLMLLNHCTRLYFLDTVFTHYRVGRQGSLADRCQESAQALSGPCRRTAPLGRPGRPGQNTPGGLRCDAGRRRRCVLAPGPHRRRKRHGPAQGLLARQLRPLYPHGTEVRTRRDSVDDADLRAAVHALGGNCSKP